jgi:hypothetical protein
LIEVILIVHNKTLAYQGEITESDGGKVTAGEEIITAL